MNDDRWLRRGFSRLVEERLGPTRHCPDAEQVAAYVDGRLDRSRAQTLESHLSDCSYCLGQVGFLTRAERPSSPPAVPARLLDAVSDPRAWDPIASRRPLVSWLAAAAGLILVVLTVGPALFENRPPSPVGEGEVTRPVSGVATERSIRGRAVSASGPVVISPQAGEAIQRTGLVVTWEPVTGVLDYSVQLMSDRGALLWDRSTEATRAVVPMDVVLDPAGRYFVRVTARLPSGEQLKSQAVEFELEPGTDP